MYKTIFFVKKTGDEHLIKIVKERIIPLLQKTFGQSISLGRIESNLFDKRELEFYFEINCDSKDLFDKLMNSNEGKNINKELSGIYSDILVYSIQF